MRTLHPPRVVTAFAIAALSFGACAKGSEKSADTSRGPADTPAVQTQGSGSAANDRFDEKPIAGLDFFERSKNAEDGRKVIRTGRIELVVGKYDEARAKLDAVLAAAGGYVDSTQVNHYQGSVSNATLVIRLPSATFGTVLPKLRELGEITSESTAAADITAQYVDIAARLTSAKALEKRLLELAAERGGGVEAVLAVERELARVRAEIEGYEGNLRQWNDQIAMSTLTLTMSTKAPAIAAGPSPGLGERISAGFGSSVQALRDFGSWFAISAIAFLPWLILVIPALLLGRRGYRRLTARIPVAVVHPAVPGNTPPVENVPAA